MCKNPNMLQSSIFWCIFMEGRSLSQKTICVHIPSGLCQVSSIFLSPWIVLLKKHLLLKSIAEKSSCVNSKRPTVMLQGWRTAILLFAGWWALLRGSGPAAFRLSISWKPCEWDPGHLLVLGWLSDSCGCFSLWCVCMIWLEVTRRGSFNGSFSFLLILVLDIYLREEMFH